MKFGIVLLGMFAMMISCHSTKEMAQKPMPLKALIIDGENNHGVWPMTTAIMRDYLLESGMFSVDVMRKANTWQGPHSDDIIGEAGRKGLIAKYPIPGVSATTMVEEPLVDENFNPDFSKYDLVVSNLGWKATDWPSATKTAFEKYMKNGGGLVVVHAADNSFGNWPEFNKMIGLGGWDGRSEKSGPYVYYDKEGKIIRDTSAGSCGSHGAQADFLLTVRAGDHPIMKGLPPIFLHGKDELYDRLRGPAENMTILATAYSDVEANSPPWDKTTKGTGRHEPMLMAIDYGKGRVFHTALGHTFYSMESVAFITTFLRGSEWAATGAVTQSIPSDFPTTTETMSRPWGK